MRDENGEIATVETPKEFIELFSKQPWEFDYISERVQNLLMSWLEDYDRIKNGRF